MPSTSVFVDVEVEDHYTFDEYEGAQHSMPSSQLRGAYDEPENLKKAINEFIKNHGYLLVSFLQVSIWSCLHLRVNCTVDRLNTLKNSLARLRSQQRPQRKQRQGVNGGSTPLRILLTSRSKQLEKRWRRRRRRRRRRRGGLMRSAKVQLIG